MTSGAMTSGAPMTSGPMSSSPMTGAMSSGPMASSGAMTSGATAPNPYPKMTGTPSSVKLGMAYDGPKGDLSFTDSAARGAEAAKAQGVDLVSELAATLGEPDSAKVARLTQLVSAGANTIVAVGYDYETAIGTVAKANPKVNFAIIDDVVPGNLPNVADLTFASEQDSFLVGVAAALKSKSGHVGFIGGVNVPLIQQFEAGFDAGAKAANPKIIVDDKYISQPPDNSGYSSPDKGQTIAKGMYAAGADVIFPAAGSSSTGVFQAAKAAGKFAIGVDSDQYNLPTLAAVKSVIITSAVKNVDVATYLFASSVAAGKPQTGVQTFDLKNGGVGFSTSGGFLTDVLPQINDFKAKIIDGTIKVPTTIGG
jgi:basic membrane protein A